MLFIFVTFTFIHLQLNHIDLPLSREFFSSRYAMLQAHSR